MTVTEIINGVAEKVDCKKTIMLRIDGLKVEVKIINIRKVWNRIDCLVTPISGNGEQWVALERLS